MSRTYRRSIVHLNWHDKPYKPRSRGWWDDGYWWWESPQHVDYYSKRNQKFDSKPWGKSVSWFKKMMQRQRRAKERNFINRKDYDNIPLFHKENDWSWT